MSDQSKALTPDLPYLPDATEPRGPDADHDSDAAYELRKAAVARLEAKAGFRAHLLSFVMVNALLIGIWGLSGGGFFWPFYPLFGWGIGLAFHGFGVYSREPTEASIQAEMRRMTPP